MIKMILPNILNVNEWYFVYINKGSHQSRGSLLPPIQMPTALTFNSLASTPSLDCCDSEPNHTDRRNSSGTLLSPEVDTGGDTDGFFLLKKDSQRRSTLAKVLANDGSKICDLWLQKVRDKYLGETVLTEKHLCRLMDGLKMFLIDQNMSVVESTVKQLKEQLDYDATAINQLQFAIYLYQESVNEVLRMHPIKPHWMFALDNLVRQCVQAAITVLMPELGEHIANSSPSTVNSSKSNKTNETYDVREPALLRNEKLLQEFIESQKQYQILAKQLTEFNKQQTEILKHICCCQNRLPREIVEEDAKLAVWLEGLGINEAAKKILLAEGYTLEEVLYYISRDDLRRVGLRGATEFRIWRAVEQHRLNGDIVICNGVTTDESGTI